MKRQRQGKRETADKKRKSNRVAKNRKVAPRTAEQFSARSERFQENWNRVAHAVSKMRKDRLSLRQASHEFGLDPRTVVRWGHSALRKEANGRYAAKSSDRLLRILVIPTPDGLREIAVKSSRQASVLAKYSAAVHRYLATGDASPLLKFRDRTIKDASGKHVPLLTSFAELNLLGSAGVLSFESLYARTA